MTAQYDIYDPPPSKTKWLPPEHIPLTFTRGDLACLAVLLVAVLGGATGAALYDLLLGALVAIGGALVVVESWYTALGYLNRRPTDVPWRRVSIILAALVPWLIGLGASAGLMIGLFALTDLGGPE